MRSCRTTALDEKRYPPGVRRFSIGLVFGKVAATLIVPLLLLAGCGNSSTDHASASSAFDGAAWRSWDGVQSTRERLAPLIARCNLLQGKTRAQARRLLGKPFDTEAHWDSWAAGVDSLGDNEILTVKFDSGGRFLRLYGYHLNL
jgi:hypothetical protein